MLKEIWKTKLFYPSCSNHNLEKTLLNLQTGTYWTCLTLEFLKSWISSKDHWTWWSSFTVRTNIPTLLLSPTINTWVVWLLRLVPKTWSGLSMKNRSDKEAPFWACWETLWTRLEKRLMTNSPTTTGPTERSRRPETDLCISTTSWKAALPSETTLVSTLAIGRNSQPHKKPTCWSARWNPPEYPMHKLFHPARPMNLLLTKPERVTGIS